MSMSKKRAKIRYNVEDAIQKLFEPSLDSDIGDLSDSESEEEYNFMNDKGEVLLDEQSNSEQSENESEVIVN